jgi:hypothetical protein
MDLEEFISRAEAEAEPGWTRSASLPSVASEGSPQSLYLNPPRHSNMHRVNGDGVAKRYCRVQMRFNAFLRSYQWHPQRRRELSSGRSVAGNKAVYRRVNKHRRYK